MWICLRVFLLQGVNFMDCTNVGTLIHDLRKEKAMTQKQLAVAMNISDKTISKWERGLGCPDVSLLRELAEILGVNIEKILNGDLDPNETDGGNMRNLKFYVCPTCGNTLTATGGPEVSCCGRKLTALIAKPADQAHEIKIESIENDYYLTFEHEMIKSHFIGFVAYVVSDRVLFVKLYPEQIGEVRFFKMFSGKIYFYCNQHGLWVSKI